MPFASNLVMRIVTAVGLVVRRCVQAAAGLGRHRHRVLVAREPGDPVTRPRRVQVRVGHRRLEAQPPHPGPLGHHRLRGVHYRTRSRVTTTRVVLTGRRHRRVDHHHQARRYHDPRHDSPPPALETHHPRLPVNGSVGRPSALYDRTVRSGMSGSVPHGPRFPTDGAAGNRCANDSRCGASGSRASTDRVSHSGSYARACLGANSSNLRAQATRLVEAHPSSRGRWGTSTRGRISLRLSRCGAPEWRARPYPQP